MKKYCIEITDMKFRKNIRLNTGLTLMLSVMMLLITSCYRRLIEEDEIILAAIIPVNIDWSESGLNVSNDVHKVSIRFFPKDGVSPVFDCYLESNPREGEILVPAGEYSVIVFNEAIQDPLWANKVVFTDVDSYSDFAANAVDLSNTARSQQFPYYNPQQGERLIIEPLQVASWKLDDFEVTNNMILVTQGQRPVTSLSVAENNMLNALTQVMMRALTRPVTVTAQVENLRSADTLYLAIQGLASKVLMASGNTTNDPSTYLFILNGRQYDEPERLHGTARKTFLSFGRTPTPELYTITADIILSSLTLYDPTPPLLFDVTSQFNTTNYLINLNINIILPFIEGGVAVDDWGDDEQHTVIE